ncbi:MAG: DUF2723 domain-containing protein [bacterium]|nr:DUF2723 domain-containing protein [bacterium]
MTHTEIDAQAHAPRWPSWWWPFLGFLLVIRLLLIPGEPWEQDEALFSAAAFDTNIAEHRPHPPGFPLWVLVGKIGLWLVGDPVFALQAVSAISSVAIIFFLAKIFAQILGSARLGQAAALLYALLPGVWFHSSRAFSTSPSLFLTVVGLWLLLRPARSNLYGGAAMMATALLVRPVMAPIILVAALAGLIHRRDRLINIAKSTVLALGIIVVGFIPLIIDAGGIASFFEPLLVHGRNHGGGLAKISWNWSELGPTRAVGGAIPAVFGLTLVLLGWWQWRSRHPKTAWGWLMVAVATAAWILLAHNRTYPRYSLPLLACCCGPCVVGLNILVRRTRWVVPITALLGFSATLWVAPAAFTVIRQPFPGLAALASANADHSANTIIVDGGLSPFSDLLTVSRRGRLPTYWRPLIAQGTVSTEALPGRWNYVWAQGTARALVPAPLDHPETFTAPGRRLALLSQQRYLTTWTTRRGGIVIDPMRPRMAPDGTLELGPATKIVLQPSSRGSWLGAVVEVSGTNSKITIDLPSHIQRSATFTPGRHHVYLPLRPPTPKRLEEPTIVEIRCTGQTEGSTILRRIWIDNPQLPPVTQSIGASAQHKNADGLVDTNNLHAVEYFGESKGGGRWTRESATLRLPAGNNGVIVRLCAPRPDPAQVIISCPALKLRHELSVGAQWQDVPIPLTRPLGRITLKIEVLNPFIPAETIADSDDTRVLGVVVGTIQMR